MTAKKIPGLPDPKHPTDPRMIFVGYRYRYDGHELDPVDLYLTAMKFERFLMFGR